jgi:mRNA interferase RelE/StbE
VTDRRYELIIAPTAKKQLAEQLPESVAFAAYEFIIGPLLNNPHRVGKQLRPPLHDRHIARRGTYRVIYRIDDEQRQVMVVGVFSRADAYLPSPCSSVHSEANGEGVFAEMDCAEQALKMGKAGRRRRRRPALSGGSKPGSVLAPGSPRVRRNRHGARSW